jgi:type I restriction-modification system DNA methylase subunit
MPRANAADAPSKQSTAPFGIEAELWLAGGKPRGHKDAADYRYAILGLIFLKYISNAFEEHRAGLEREFTDPEGEWFVSKERTRMAKFSKFASAYGENGAQFYTPNCFVRVLVEKLARFEVRVYAEYNSQAFGCVNG